MFSVLLHTFHLQPCFIFSFVFLHCQHAPRGKRNPSSRFYGDTKSNFQSASVCVHYNKRGGFTIGGKMNCESARLLFKLLP